MSVLSSTDFANSQPEAIVTRPDGDVTIQPSSVDLHLDSKYGWFADQTRPVHVSNGQTHPSFIEQDNDDIGIITIGAGEFILANTEETVSLPDGAVGFLHGRSSVGRLGLFVHNAGVVDAGFSGQLTLELYNASRNSIKLDVGMRICQMTVHEHKNKPAVGYSDQSGSKYQNQSGPTASKLYDDVD